MSYQVLARKWRPRNFAEMVGQEHVVRALTNALDNDRLHHAYLFTGTRGVGKTTLARILSKSLNCEQGVSSTPCGECSICKEIDEGRFPDLLEVDAASRTKVDQTRELLDNVPYAPVRGRYKVYLIDEVHMFSDSSFNALLKTLEEPPPHVKFLLATTDPQKVPVTVLSRCLQFNLKRLPIEQIQGQFRHILDAEATPYDDAALLTIARAADGSMRDGLSLLDQAIAFGGGKVESDAVRSMLGVVAVDKLPALLQAVHQGEGEGMLSLVAQLAEQVPDFASLLKDLLTLLHRLALLQAVPDAADPAWGDLEPLRELAAGIAPEDVQLYYQMGLMGQRDLPLAPDPRSGFEMTLLRMLAFRPAVDEGGGNAPARAAAHPATAPSQPRPAAGRGTSPAARVKAALASDEAPAAAAAEARPAPAAEPEPAPAAVAEPPSAPVEPTAAPAGQADLSDWHRVVAQLGLGGLASQLADHCAVAEWVEGRLLLHIDPSYASMVGSKAQQRLHQALNSYCGREIALSIETVEVKQQTPAQARAEQAADRQATAEQSMAEDGLVKALETRFDAELLTDSVRPVKP